MNTNTDILMPSHENKLLEYLPGKTDCNAPGKWLPVWMHLEDTAEMMRLLIRNWLPDIIKRNIPDIERLGIFVGLTHDIGKMTPVFADRIQNVLTENKQFLESLGLPISTFSKNKPHPHAYMGMCILRKLDCPWGISVVVASHHGKPPGIVEFNESDNDIEDNGEYYYDGKEEIWSEIHQQWFDYSLEKSGYESVKNLPELDMQAQMLLTGLLIMADWLASNTDYFPLIDDLDNYHDFSDRYKNVWETIGLPNLWAPVSYNLDEARFDHLFQNKPYKIQQKFFDIINNAEAPGIYILEAPMGCGKTEAALSAAERLDSNFGCGGLFFGLPTQATANGIFKRLEDWAEKRAKEENAVMAIRLAHSMAELNEKYHDLKLQSLFHNNTDSLIDDDDEGRLIVHSWFNGKKQALLANFVIGTVDQMLMAALGKKHVMLRHLGLAGKVVILDECHAYDAYMNRFMDRALQWLGSYGTPVIILSATLPASRRVELINAYLDGKASKSDSQWEYSDKYPLITWTEGTEVKQDYEEIEDDKKHPVYIRHLENEKIIECLQENLTDGGYAGIIVNTVKTSQNLMEELQNVFPDADIRLFHSQFLAPVRAEKEEKLLQLLGRSAPRKKGEKMIIIGTQVLEQSLDLDFDMLITELCPMDLLLQRIGRLHRHKDHDADRPEKLKKAQCFVLPASDAAKKIYAEWLLRTTERLLPDIISIPDDISKLVQTAYTEPDSHSNLWDNYINTIEIRKAKAQLIIPENKKRNSPRNNTIAGLLNNEFLGNDQQAEIGVRDGEDSIEVILLLRRGDRALLISHKNENCSFSISSSIQNSAAEREIASQRIRLPFKFSRKNMINRVIAELIDRNQNEIPLWQDSKWIRGQLVLFLDENQETDLCGIHLVYDNEFGLREVINE